MLIACGKDNIKVISNDENNVLAGDEITMVPVNDEENIQKSGYYFTFEDIDIVIDSDMSLIESKLGEPLAYFEEPSCAAQGIGKLYTYKNFTINTYPDGEIDRIACIILKDDLVETREGADLSKSKEEIISIYGDTYTETDTLIKYIKDGIGINFIFREGELVSIEYDSSVLE
jgi:hypothetical protein